MPDAPFHDNVVIITGASSGIGRGLALALAGQGAHLALAARDAARLDEVEGECRRRGGKVISVPTDVSDESQCRNLIIRTVGAYGRLDTLINNAGISMAARFEELRTLAPLEEIMRVNYLGAVYCTYHALPHLKRTRGRIVAVADRGGEAGLPTRSGYAASKYALTGFCDALRTELRDSGVSVTVVYPAAVATELAERALGPGGHPLGKTAVRRDAAMSAEESARRIVSAAAERQPRLGMESGRFSNWLGRLVARSP